MKIGYVQNSPVFGEKEKNFNQIRKLLGHTKADLIVLPELFAVGYAFTSKKEVKDLAETTNEETADFLKELSFKTGAVIVAGFIEKEDGKIYNATMMVYKNKVTGTYRKIHLFNKEKFWFTPGNKKLQVPNIKGIKIQIIIFFSLPIRFAVTAKILFSRHLVTMAFWQCGITKFEGWAII